MNNQSTLDKLTSRLTQQQIATFIRAALPELADKHFELQSTLDQQQWKLAASQAHQLKSTISLFSCNDFVAILDLIEAKQYQPTELSHLKASLMHQHEQLQASLTSHLKSM